MAKATEYKYKLNSILDLMPRAATIEMITKELEKEGISERTFFRDRSLKIDDSATITADRLMIYAKFFSVSIEDLYNYTSKVKPITDRKLSDFESNVANKSGLKKK